MQFPGASQSLHTSSGYWSRLTRAQEPTAHTSPQLSLQRHTPGNRVQPWWEYGRHTPCLFSFFFWELSFKHLSVHRGPYRVAFFPFMFTLKKISLIAWVRDESQLCQFHAMKPQTVYLISLCLSFSIYKTQIISYFTELWELNAKVYAKCRVLLHMLFWPTLRRLCEGKQAGGRTVYPRGLCLPPRTACSGRFSLKASHFETDLIYDAILLRVSM